MDRRGRDNRDRKRNLNGNAASGSGSSYVKLKHPDYNQREVYSVFRDYAVDLGEPGKDTEFGYGYVDFTNYAAEDQNTAKNIRRSQHRLRLIKR